MVFAKVEEAVFEETEDLGETTRNENALEARVKIEVE